MKNDNGIGTQIDRNDNMVVNVKIDNKNKSNDDSGTNLLRMMKIVSMLQLILMTKWDIRIRINQLAL